MTKQDDFPTPGQLKYIAVLSAKLRIPEPKVGSYGEAGRMIRELEAENRHRARVKSDVLVREIYNALANHGRSLHYDIITSMIQKERPGLGITDQKVLATLNSRKDLFVKLDPGVYWLASKKEGMTHEQI